MNGRLNGPLIEPDGDDQTIKKFKAMIISWNSKRNSYKIQNCLFSRNDYVRSTFIVIVSQIASWPFLHNHFGVPIKYRAKDQAKYLFLFGTSNESLMKYVRYRKNKPFDTVPCDWFVGDGERGLFRAFFA